MPSSLRRITPYLAAGAVTHMTLRAFPLTTAVTRAQILMVCQCA